MSKVEHHHTRKKFVKASVVHVLQAKRPLCPASMNNISLVPYVLSLSFMAVANQLHNIVVPKTCKVETLRVKFVIVKSYDVMEHLDSNLLPILIHSLFNTIIKSYFGLDLISSINLTLSVLIFLEN